MLNGILNYINCCKTSNILDKCILKVENEQSTNEPTEKNNIPLNEGIKKIIIENKSKDSIITFSDTKVKQNNIKKKSFRYFSNRIKRINIRRRYIL